METEQKINYSFIAIPTNFIYLLDNDCFKLFCILLQKHTYWLNNNKLEDGYFSKSIKELSTELGMSNLKDVRLTIEALYRAKLVDVISVERKRDSAKFKLNLKKIEELGNQSMFDSLEFDERIIKLPRQTELTYLGTNLGTNCTTSNTNLGTNLGTNCTTTIDNIDKKENINKINNKNNINNNIDIINILKEKNNNKLLEEKKVEITVTNVNDSSNENNNNMNGLNEKIKECFERMNEIKSIDELNKKIVQFKEWFNKKIKNDSSIDVSLFQNELIKKSNEIFKKLYPNDERKFNVVEVGMKLVQNKKKLSQLETISNEEKNDIINFVNSNLSFIYFMESSTDLLKLSQNVLSKLDEIQVMEYEPITQNAK